jgi:hypothetical protein
MLNALLVALSLGGVPGFVARFRRPVALVRHDRVREPRGSTHLAGLARRLMREATAAPAPTILEWDWSETRTASMSTGAQTAFFRER